MPLPTAGQAISLSQVNTELGNSSTAQISLNDAAVRSLFGKASGAISMSDGHGKSAAFAASITTNQVEMNLRTFAVNAGWNQSSIATITLNSSVYVSSNATGTAAMTINGSWPGGVTLVNNGFIMGRGGNGCFSNFPAPGQTLAQAGGVAISLGVNCSITNNSGAFIGGGGGGGGSGGEGGGGGGAGGATGGPGSPGVGGAGGGVGQAGAAGTAQGVPIPGSNAGGGGGRIFPGTGGAGGTQLSRNGKGGGAGGGGGAYVAKYFSVGGAGGAGGSTGSNGGASNGFAGGRGGAGGGGWGASGGSATVLPGAPNPPARVGAAGGRAIALNGYTATRTGAGTTFGAVS